MPVIWTSELRIVTASGFYILILTVWQDRVWCVLRLIQSLPINMISKFSIRKNLRQYYVLLKIFGFSLFRNESKLYVFNNDTTEHLNSSYITKNFHKGANFQWWGMGGNPICHTLRIHDILFQAERYMCQDILVYIKSLYCAQVLG